MKVYVVQCGGSAKTFCKVLDKEVRTSKRANCFIQIAESSGPFSFHQGGMNLREQPKRVLYSRGRLGQPRMLLIGSCNTTPSGVLDFSADTHTLCSLRLKVTLCIAICQSSVL